MFDALETARVEALGAKAMDGVRANLSDLAEARVRLDSITRARTAEEVPLATAVGLLARQRLTGEAPPQAARAGLELVAPWIEDKAGAELDALALTIDDQAAFATLSRRLLEDLDLPIEESADQQPEEGGDEDRGEDEGPDDADDAETEGGDAGGEMEMRSEEAERDEGEDECADSEADVDEGEATSGQEAPTRRGPTPSAAIGSRSRSPTTSRSPPASTKWSPPASCATRRNSPGCAPISTSR